MIYGPDKSNEWNKDERKPVNSHKLSRTVPASEVNLNYQIIIHVLFRELYLGFRRRDREIVKCTASLENDFDVNWKDR